MRLILLAALMVLVTVADEATADPRDKTVRYDLEVYRNSGKLVGCGFSFSQVVFDHTYENGQPVILTGSINSLYFSGKATNFSFKINGSKIDLTTETPQPFHINYAYLIADGQSFAGKEISPSRCEDGGFCSTIVKDYNVILTALFKNKIEISYNRRPDGLDVSFKIDASQAIDGVKNLNEGLSCFKQLLERFVNKN